MTQVSWCQKNTSCLCGYYTTSLISFLHFLWSTASFFCIYRVWQKRSCMDNELVLKASCPSCCDFQQLWKHTVVVLFTVDLSPSTCSGNTLEDTAFPHCPVVSEFLRNLSMLSWCSADPLSQCRSRSSQAFQVLLCHLLGTMSMLDVVFVYRSFSVYVAAIVALSSWGWLPWSSFRFSVFISS